MNRVEINGVKVVMKSGLEAIAHCRRATLSMADGKMVTTLLQLGGAYCTMCTKSQPQCHSREIIEEGFVIDRSVESLNDLALSLTDKDTGEVVGKRGDYGDYGGRELWTNQFQRVTIPRLYRFVTKKFGHLSG